MKPRVHWRAALGVAAVLSVLAGAHVAAQYAGWKLPEGAAGEKSPLASNAGARNEARRSSRRTAHDAMVPPERATARTPTRPRT